MHAALRARGVAVLLVASFGVARADDSFCTERSNGLAAADWTQAMDRCRIVADAIVQGRADALAQLTALDAFISAHLPAPVAPQVDCRLEVALRRDQMTAEVARHLAEERELLARVLHGDGRKAAVKRKLPGKPKPVGDLTDPFR